MENEIKEYITNHLAPLATEIQTKIGGMPRIDAICALLTLAMYHAQEANQKDENVKTATMAVNDALDNFLALGVLSLKFRDEAETDGK
jgi:hypothetical protein